MLPVGYITFVNNSGKANLSGKYSVGMWGQHLVWYRRKKSFLRRRYTKDERIYFVVFIKLCNLCFVGCSIVSIPDKWPPNRVRKILIVSFPYIYCWNILEARDNSGMPNWTFADRPMHLESGQFQGAGFPFAACETPDGWLFESQGLKYTLFERSGKMEYQSFALATHKEPSWADQLLSDLSLSVVPPLLLNKSDQLGFPQIMCIFVHLPLTAHAWSRKVKLWLT